jgi:hypothetical protein
VGQKSYGRVIKTMEKKIKIKQINSKTNRDPDKNVQN